MENLPPLILNIESSSGYCSIALTRGEHVIIENISFKINSTADELHLMVQESLEKSQLVFEDISAIAVSGGPGSYTGLRIGVSAAKGYAYALKIPLIHVETFHIMKVEFQKKHKYFFDYFIPMIDARRMDAFVSVLNIVEEYVEEPICITIDEYFFETYARHGNVAVFGNKLDRFSDILTKNGISFFNDVVANANSMANLSYVKFLQNEFVDLAYYEPKYYKSFHSSIK